MLNTTLERSIWNFTDELQYASHKYYKKIFYNHLIEISIVFYFYSKPLKDALSMKKYLPNSWCKACSVSSLDIVWSCVIALKQLDDTPVILLSFQFMWFSGDPEIDKIKNMNLYLFVLLTVLGIQWFYKHSKLIIFQYLFLPRN